MLTIGRHGTRRTPPLTPDRGSCYLSLLERSPSLTGRHFLLSTHDELGEYRCHIPLTLTELQILHDQIGEHLDAQTIEEHVPATDIRLGDIITDLTTDVCVWGLGHGPPTAAGAETVLIDYQDREGTQGTFVAIVGLSDFTVRVPRPPAERRHPEDVGS